MLYVSENSLPTYFTYGFKDDRIPRHLTLFPNDRKVLNEEEGKAQGTGSLFIGCYNEEGGKAMVEVEVKSEADEPSAAMLNIEERVEYLHALSNHGSGELVSKVSGASEEKNWNVIVYSYLTESLYAIDAISHSNLFAHRSSRTSVP